MKKIVLLTLALLAFATSASAVQLFDFDGQTILPAAIGNDAQMYGRIVNGTAVPTPLPLDFANYKYTIVVTGLTRATSGATSDFSNGTVAIYQDNATDSDWANAATFSDGVAILSGTMALFQHTMLTATLGTGLGYVDWTGGSMLNDLAVADQTNWPLLTGISRSPTQVEPDYTEQWNGKVEPTEDVVANQESSWSDLKARFR